VGFGPHVVDLNGDGYPDIISGSWPGELFFFEGAKEGTHLAPVMLKDKEGKIINIAGGLSEWREGGLLIKGNAEFETTDEGTFVNYHGQRLKSTAERPIAISGTASVVTAADWDADGDYDLIVGTISGSIHLLVNEGTAKSYSFAKEQSLYADGKEVRVSAQAGVCVVDWDGDGDVDLLVGTGDGSVVFFENIGTAESPKLAAGVEIVPRGTIAYGADAPKEVRRGIRAKVCAADFNGDGKLDLLVGDNATRKPDLPEPTAEEQAKYDEIRKQLEPLNERVGELFAMMHEPERAKDEQQLKAANEEYRKVSKRMQELSSQLPRQSQTHGWVWLFVRK